MSQIGLRTNKQLLRKLTITLGLILSAVIMTFGMVGVADAAESFAPTSNFAQSSSKKKKGCSKKWQTRKKGKCVNKTCPKKGHTRNNKGVCTKPFKAKPVAKSVGGDGDCTTMAYRDDQGFKCNPNTKDQGTCRGLGGHAILDAAGKPKCIKKGSKCNGGWQELGGPACLKPDGLAGKRIADEGTPKAPIPGSDAPGKNPLIVNGAKSPPYSKIDTDKNFRYANCLYDNVGPGKDPKLLVERCDKDYLSNQYQDCIRKNVKVGGVFTTRHNAQVRCVGL